MGIGIRKLDGELLPAKLSGLLDRGADFSAFPYEFMAELGIDERSDDVHEVAGTTAGGSMSRLLYTHGITIEYLGHVVKVAGYFNPGLSVVLLGRADFLVHYVAEFDVRKGEVSLERHPRELPRDPVAEHVEEVLADLKAMRQQENNH